MAGYMCLCGHRVNLSPIPNPYGFDLIADVLSENIFEKLIDAHNEATSDEDFFKRAAIAISHLESPGILEAHECPECGRIQVIAGTNPDGPVFWFQLEKITGDSALPVSSLRELVNALEPPETSEESK
jgi:hypothetical protein